jgi:hypothetical protein
MDLERVCREGQLLLVEADALLDGTMMIIDRDLAVVHKRSLEGTASLYKDERLKRRLEFLWFLKRSGMRLI